ncbi:MAG: DUF2520 domain-containing protein [Bacteroidales bacterium]|nr:DUF2520 domain-containing protein [Bacteroidales bacterium]
MEIALIGSGNVATHLGLAFKQAGAVVTVVWSRNADHADDLAKVLGCRATTSLQETVGLADCYIIAVTDDAISCVADQLKLGDSLVVHTSGSVSADILRDTSSSYGVLWSPTSFVKGKVMDYSSLPICIEGSDDKTFRAIRLLASMISEHIYTMNCEQRKWTHLAAVFVNNFVNSLNASAEQFLSSRNIDFSVLLPIIQATASQVSSGNLSTLQTGPAARDDRATIERQRAMLEGNPELLHVYDALTELIRYQKQ